MSKAMHQEVKEVVPKDPPASLAMSQPSPQGDQALLELAHPTKEAIAALPPYAQLPLKRILVVRSRADEDFAIARMAECGIVGFDTETKPVFQAGQSTNGPHIIQLATLDHAFIFQITGSVISDALRECLESAHLLKVGFGLNSDRGPLHRKFGIKLQNFVDVSQLFRPLGYRQRVGAKASVAIVLGMRLQKSKSMTTSNWSARHLTPGQLQYAADDAQAGLAVYLALGCPQQPQRVRRVSSVATLHLASSEACSAA